MNLVESFTISLPSCTIRLLQNFRQVLSHPSLASKVILPQLWRHPGTGASKIKVKYGGICGSDTNLMFLHDSPSTSPFASFPFIIGHEFVGVIAETGSEVKHLAPGDRVVTDPVLSCIGACRDTGGSWSPYLVAHQSQVFKLPPQVDDLNAVMVEPFSCALHSLLQNPLKSGDTVLVIGAGIIGICVIAAIRALDIPCRIVVLAKHQFQSKLAEEHGADAVIRISRGDGHFPETASFLHARLLKPLFGSPIVQGGADVVFECVGNNQSVNDALRFAKSGGKIVLLGLTGILDQMDWTTVWMNELTIKGSFAYGTEEYNEKKLHTHEIAINLMSEGKIDLSSLVTHRFPLEQYKKALTTTIRKRHQTVMKVVFEP